MIPRVSRNNVAYLINHLVRGMENQCVPFRIGTKLLRMNVPYNARKHVFVEVMFVLLSAPL